MQEFYEKDGMVEPSSTWSVSLVIYVASINDNFIRESHTAPRDGDLYAYEIKKTFSERLVKYYFQFSSISENGST